MADKISGLTEQIPSRKLKLAGLGIDIVALKRVRSLMKVHGPRLARKILSPNEAVQYSLKPFSAVELAKRFSAKEAYFKSLNRDWLGIEGFQKIDIEPLSRNQFRAFWLDRGSRTCEAEGCFYAGPRWVAAQVIRWASPCNQTRDHSALKDE